LVPRIAAEIDAVTSPSWISLIRAPAARISSIRSWWRGTVEDDRRDVVDAAPESLGDPADVLGDRAAQIDRGAGPRADRQLAHVHVGQGLKRAGLADRDHRHRPSPAPRDHTTSFQRVERQIDLLAAGSHALSPREGLVLVRTGADHDVTVDGRCSSADRIASAESRSAPSWSARPSQRAPASAARSVARA
jgi:hypothetical protein